MKGHMFDMGTYATRPRGPGRHEFRLNCKDKILSRYRVSSQLQGIMYNSLSSFFLFVESD